jgi:hypothetical protein
VPGPQLRVLLELLELDELVTVPWPLSVVVLGVGVPPEEVSTQFEELGLEVGVGVNVTLFAAETARRTASRTAGADSAGTPLFVATITGGGPAKILGRSSAELPVSGLTGAKIAVFLARFAAPEGDTVKIEANAIATAETTAVHHVLVARSTGNLCVFRGCMNPTSAQNKSGAKRTIDQPERDTQEKRGKFHEQITRLFFPAIQPGNVAVLRPPREPA